MIQSGGSASNVGTGSVSILLARNPIPLAIAPTFTGTLVAGEIELGTALPLAVPNLFIYFDADALETGNAAGFYYCVMTSATEGVVYNNTYTPAAGVVPEIPTTLVPFDDPIVGGAGHTDPVIVHYTTVPANILGSRGVLSLGGTFSQVEADATFAASIDPEGFVLALNLPETVIGLEGCHLHAGYGYVRSDVALVSSDIFSQALISVDMTVDRELSIILSSNAATNCVMLCDYQITVDNR
jgi:hypothetical protein